MWWLVLIVIGVAFALRLLSRMYRNAIPTVIEAYDAADRVTAFGEAERKVLEAAHFDDGGVQLIDIGGLSAVMHLFQRASDGTVVTGLCRPDGSNPAHYLTTLLAQGRGSLDTRCTDRTPAARGGMVQVLPEASLAELVSAHDRGLAAIKTHGVAPVRSVDAFGVHVHQGKAARRSLRHNPLRWLFGLMWRSVRPTTRRDVASLPRLERRLAGMGLT